MALPMNGTPRGWTNRLSEIHDVDLVLGGEALELAPLPM
jgi:hypothetical protein